MTSNDDKQLLMKVIYEQKIRQCLSTDELSDRCLKIAHIVISGNAPCFKNFIEELSLAEVEKVLSVLGDVKQDEPSERYLKKIIGCFVKEYERADNAVSNLKRILEVMEIAFGHAYLTEFGSKKRVDHAKLVAQLKDHMNFMRGKAAASAAATSDHAIDLSGMRID